jgi:hypothetical protein
MKLRRALALAVMTVLACGCGGGDSGSTKAEPTPRRASAVPANLLTETDLKRAPTRSPQRALLEWFQAIQYSDLRGVRRLSSSAATKDLDLAAILKLAGPGFARPQIRDVNVEGDRATVRLLLLSYEGGTGEVAIAQPTTIPLRRVGDAWVVSDLTLLVSSADAIYQQQQLEKRKQDG